MGLHWAQQTDQTCVQLVDKNNRYFQTMAKIIKEAKENIKIKDEQGDYNENQKAIKRLLQAIQVGQYYQS